MGAAWASVLLRLQTQGMSLRDLLDLCQNKHSDDWVLVPGNRPATTMLAGLFDPGMKDEAKTRPLAGHSIAVYEPDPQLSMVWPIPEEPEAERPDRLERFIPEWAEKDGHGWKNANMSTSSFSSAERRFGRRPSGISIGDRASVATSHISKRCSATTSLTENGRKSAGTYLSGRWAWLASSTPLGRRASGMPTTRRRA